MRKQRIRIFLLLLFTIILPHGLQAQSEEGPVRWTHSVKALTNDAFEITFTTHIAPPWHIYDMGPYDNGITATRFTVTPNPELKILSAPKALAPPRRIYDSLYQSEIGHFSSNAQFSMRVQLLKSGTSTSLRTLIEWMACSNNSCLAPDEISLSIPIRDTSKLINAAPPKAGIIPEEDSTEATISTTVLRMDEQEKLVDRTSPISDKSNPSTWSLIIEAVLWGFAALLTPCVFPMVPMTVSFFMKEGGDKQRGRMMALLYGMSIVLLYTLPITVIILITQLIGGEAVTADIFNWLATHWVPNVAFFVVFLLFAISFFGAFEITLPSWMVNQSDNKADKGGLIGIFFMALTLVLVSFSCTGPIVGTVLIKSTSGEVWSPVLTMLAFSIAFALPFTLFAFFPSLLNRLPKSGGWLNSIKIVLGFLELALGLKFLSVADQTYHWGLLDREVYLALWIVIFTLLGLYLLGKLRFAHDSEQRSVSVPRLLLAVITLSFVVYMIPGMWGAPLKGLSGYLPPIQTQDFVLDSESTPVHPSQNEMDKPPKYSDFLALPHGLSGFFDLNEALAYTQEVGKPLLVNYTGHGCVNCREMEAKVWADPKVLDLLREEFVIVALYSDDKKTLPQSDWVTTSNGKVLKSLGKINAQLARERFQVNSQPYYIILSGTGKPLAPGRGYNLDIGEFVEFLQTGLNNFQSEE